MGSDFGIPGGTGGKVHQRNFVELIVYPADEIAMVGIFRVEMIPSFSGRTYHDFGFNAVVFFHGQFNLMGYIPLGGTNQSGYAGCLETVNQIFFHQLVGGRDNNGTQLMKCQDGIPKLVVSFQNQHDTIAFFDTQ